MRLQTRLRGGCVPVWERLSYTYTSKSSSQSSRFWQTLRWNCGIVAKWELELGKLITTCAFDFFTINHSLEHCQLGHQHKDVETPSADPAASIGISIYVRQQQPLLEGQGQGTTFLLGTSLSIYLGIISHRRIVKLLGTLIIVATFLLCIILVTMCQWHDNIFFELMGNRQLPIWFDLYKQFEITTWAFLVE